MCGSAHKYGNSVWAIFCTTAVLVSVIVTSEPGVLNFFLFFFWCESSIFLQSETTVHYLHYEARPKKKERKRAFSKISFPDARELLTLGKKEEEKKEFLGRRSAALGKNNRAWSENSCSLFSRVKRKTNKKNKEKENLSHSTISTRPRTSSVVFFRSSSGLPGFRIFEAE